MAIAVATDPAAVNRKGDAAASEAALLQDEVLDRCEGLNFSTVAMRAQRIHTVTVRPSEFRGLPTVRAERKAERAYMLRLLAQLRTKEK